MLDLRTITQIDCSLDEQGRIVLLLTFRIEQDDARYPQIAQELIAMRPDIAPVLEVQG